MDSASRIKTSQVKHLFNMNKNEEFKILWAKVSRKEGYAVVVEQFFEQSLIQ